MECTVFGSIIGKKLPIKQRHTGVVSAQTQESKSKRQDKQITMAEVEEHNRDDDCWVVLHGMVYDLTAFADEHPAGAESIHVLAGKDGSKAFSAVHNKGLLDDFDEERIGVLVEA